MSYELLTTYDGSITLKDFTTGETYHSIHGARSESLHVFINNGLKLKRNNVHLNIFEMGFGTGLNAMLTYFEKSPSQSIYYEAIDVFPLPEEVFNKITKQFIHENEKECYLKIMKSDWNIPVQISELFTLHKRMIDFKEYSFLTLFDLVYFDAFSPKNQPELWTTELLTKIFNGMNHNSVFVTYACTGLVKRNLREAGFEVQRLSGAPPKRHMIRAIKKIK